MQLQRQAAVPMRLWSATLTQRRLQTLDTLMYLVPTNKQLPERYMAAALSGLHQPQAHHQR